MTLQYKWNIKVGNHSLNFIWNEKCGKNIKYPVLWFYLREFATLFWFWIIHQYPRRPWYKTGNKTDCTWKRYLRTTWSWAKSVSINNFLILWTKFLKLSLICFSDFSPSIQTNFFFNLFATLYPGAGTSLSDSSALFSDSLTKIRVICINTSLWRHFDHTFGGFMEI